MVLVTGAAGFVGFHTALQLHNEGDVVLGLDNFNHYYDIRLKRTRASLLRRAGMTTLFEGDVCDGELLTTILKSGRVTNVIHLAAQAGVRYSLKKPLAYVEANVRCFVQILESVHAANNSIPITYASSSSVYGTNKVIPFSEKHQVDSQASLYGATKKSNENIAHVYHSLHGLKLTGLRFFTVYGPLGRPDMAYFGFTQAILGGKRITEFRNADGTELMRDFTYITDIVSGVVAAMRLEAPLEVFNLGNTKPEKVSKLIGLLEEGLGRKANVTQAPISAGDVPMTYADVSRRAAAPRLFSAGVAGIGRASLPAVVLGLLQRQTARCDGADAAGGSRAAREVRHRQPGGRRRQRAGQKPQAAHVWSAAHANAGGRCRAL